jgi:predicted amidohydrolase
MKLALWQTAGTPADVPANLAALDAAAGAAAAAGASLLLTPECWLAGYNIGAAIGDLAEARDGPSAAQIARCAQRHAIAIAYGYAERDPLTRAVFNSAHLISAAGASQSHYRKTHLFGPMERAAFQAGDRFVPPCRLGEFSVCLLICYDVEFPETVRTLKLLGADLILVPTATPEVYPTVPACLVPARAIENQLAIAYCNHAGAENGMRFLGGSRLVAADGSIIAAAGTGEALLVTQIDRESLADRAGLYPYLADRRPELYSQLVRK